MGGHPTALFLSHRIFHPVPAEQVQVHVEYRLPAVCAGVEDQPVAIFMNTLLFRQLFCHKSHMTCQLLILLGEIVE